MKVYTSYFANSANLRKQGIVMIGIALYPPKWFDGKSVKLVAPSYDILKNSTSTENYVERFKTEILAKRNAKQFFEAIEFIGQGKDVALCCFEKPNEFCHRHLVAEWLKEQLGLEVEEFGISHNPQYRQGDLF